MSTPRIILAVVLLPLILIGLGGLTMALVVAGERLLPTPQDVVRWRL